MIKISDHSTIIYTDHGANSAIASQIKLSTINIDKLNMKLIRAFTYLSQFNLDIRHRSDKFNVISDALSRLSTKFIFSVIDSLDLDSYDSVTKSSIDHVYNISLMIMSNEFRQKLIVEYNEDSV